MIGIKITKLIKGLLQLDLVKVFSITAISTSVKILTAFVSIKIIASILGPSGIALIGQLNNFTTIIMAIASAGINQGVTKYISEYKTDEGEVKKYIRTSFQITFLFSIASGILLLIFSEYLSQTIFKSSEFAYVFVLFGCVIVLYALNNLMLSIVNGYKEYKKYVKINIINSLVGLVFTVTLVYFWELKGALISFISYQSVMFFVTFWMLRKKIWIQFLKFSWNFDIIIYRKYLQYTLMAITTAVTVPVSQLYIRSYVIQNISMTDAGYWESMNKLSAMYLMIITSSLSVYFLPKLAEIKTDTAIRKEIFKAYKIILPFLAGALGIIYVFKFIIIRILFSEEFLPMSDLFKYQLIGDFLKISSLLLAFLMIAKSMTVRFITTEILTSASFVLLSLYFVKGNGVVGITQAYMLNYGMYLILMVILFRKLVFNTKQ